MSEHFLLDQLDGNLRSQREVLCGPDRAHRPVSELLQQAILAGDDPPNRHRSEPIANPAPNEARLRESLRVGNFEGGAGWARDGRRAPWTRGPVKPNRTVFITSPAGALTARFEQRAGLGARLFLRRGTDQLQSVCNATGAATSEPERDTRE
jgi:hypothetical protein